MVRGWHSEWAVSIGNNDKAAELSMHCIARAVEELGVKLSVIIVEADVDEELVVDGVVLDDDAVVVDSVVVDAVVVVGPEQTIPIDAFNCATVNCVKICRFDGTISAGK